MFLLFFHLDLFKVYQDVITGVQIINTNPLQIAFGCIGQQGEEGGAGYLFANSQGTITNVTAIEDSKGRIFAGPIVAIDGCGDSAEKRDLEYLKRLQRSLL